METVGAAVQAPCLHQRASRGGTRPCLPMLGPTPPPTLLGVPAEPKDFSASLSAASRPMEPERPPAEAILPGIAAASGPRAPLSLASK